MHLSNEEIIERFKNQMLIELENNSKKGNIFIWRGISDKLIDLEYHKAKLLLAIKEKNKFAMKEYIADCSNILLSIGNEFNLYAEESTNTNKEAILIDNTIQIKDLGISKIKKLI